MRIYVVDSWRKHWNEGVDWWRRQGHEVKTGPNWDVALTEWAGVTLFHPVDNNLKVASKKGPKPPGTVVVAEAVDIDIYSGHLGGVDWSYVDVLVFMAEHMREYAEKRHKNLPPSHVIPGGVDLDRWTLRQGERGYNVAWIGRLWIAKNVFGALQIFHQLVKTDPANPWRLFLRGDGWHPPTWWSRHCEAYIETYPELAGRVEFVGQVKDVNAWLDDKDFLLQTSYKEAFGYVVAQAAAKGIRPVVQFTTGALDLWPREWVFATHDEAVAVMLDGYEREAVRDRVAERYPIAKRMESFDSIIRQIQEV